MKNKIIDCITFFNENFIFELRYNIVKKYVDYLVVCESEYDHRGNKKNLNFDYKKYSHDQKIKYLIHKEPFPKNHNPWVNQAIQREFILKNLTFAENEDYIFFSDPDEIPNPALYQDFKLEKKYGIFLQKSFVYKFNLFNKYESPWEGTRVCKKKNLKSIDFMRQHVKSKNLKYSFLRFDKEKNIQIFYNGGWHFNNIMTSEEISKKLKIDIINKLNKILKVDISKHIEMERILSPKDIEIKTLSKFGSLYGSSSNSMNSAFLRHPNFSNQIKNLFFCGGSVHLGRGIP